MEPAEPRALLHTAHVPVRWGDMDAFGHVNNAVVFRYFEQARIEAFYAAFPGGVPPDGNPVLASITVEYRRPIHFPATAVVRVWAGRAGRTSFHHAYDLRLDGDGDTVYATAQARMVWVGRDGRPAPLPDPLRATHPVS